MRWLTRLLDRLAPNADRERGATATIVAILLSGGVIMGMLAVSVDLGNLTYERRQVQNGADATSLALAQACATDVNTCKPESAADLLDPNARDATMQYGSRADAPYGACARGTTAQVGATPLCVSGISGLPSDPDALIKDLGACPPLPPWLLGTGSNIPYVETYAKTQTGTGANDKLFLPFSRVLAGGAAGDAGTSACARAAWGTPIGYTSALPLTISQCEWHTQIIDGSGYEAPPVGLKPGYDNVDPAIPDWPGSEIVFNFHGVPNPEGCDTWKGSDFPGGFGWLGDSTQCEAQVSVDGWVQTNPGGAAPKLCKDLLPDLRGTVVDIPVFDCSVGDEDLAAGDPPLTGCNTGNGSKSWYHIAGWAKFYVSGYRFPSLDEPSYLSGSVPCDPSKSCLSGWFVTGVLSGAPEITVPGGPEDFGAYAVKPAG